MVASRNVGCFLRLTTDKSRYHVKLLNIVYEVYQSIKVLTCVCSCSSNERSWITLGKNKGKEKQDVKMKFT